MKLSFLRLIVIALIGYMQVHGQFFPFKSPPTPNVAAAGSGPPQPSPTNGLESPVASMSPSPFPKSDSPMSTVPPTPQTTAQVSSTTIAPLTTTIVSTTTIASSSTSTTAQKTFTLSPSSAPPPTDSSDRVAVGLGIAGGIVGFIVLLGLGVFIYRKVRRLDEDELSFDDPSLIEPYSSSYKRETPMPRSDFGRSRAITYGAGTAMSGQQQYAQYPTIGRPGLPGIVERSGNPGFVETPDQTDFNYYASNQYAYPQQHMYYQPPGAAHGGYGDSFHGYYEGQKSPYE